MIRYNHRVNKFKYRGVDWLVWRLHSRKDKIIQPLVHKGPKPTHFKVFAVILLVLLDTQPALRLDLLVRIFINNIKIVTNHFEQLIC